MTYLFIKNLKINSRIGAYLHEQQISQPLYLDLEMNLNSRQNGRLDQLESTIDYTLINQYISDFAQLQHYNLIETFAEKLADKLIVQFNIAELQLTVRKPSALANADYAGIRLTRRCKAE